MDDVLSPSFLTTVVALGITAAVPLLFASLGEIFAEQSGVLNVGLEGMMITGAFVGFVVTLETRELWSGLIGGGIAGALVSLIMVLFCIRLGLDQIVVGIGIVLAAEGATSLLHSVWFAHSRPRLPAIDELAVPLLSDLPVLGGSVFTQPLPAYLGLGLVIVSGWIMRRTTIGLNLRAAGERPDSLDAAGVSVVRVRGAAEITCGALAGIGGAYLSIVEAGTFGPFVTGGVGFIAIVIAMLARGRVYWSILGGLLFGMSLSIAAALQLLGVAIPSDFVFMLPFVSIIIVLIVFAREARLPSALGLPYYRGSR